MRQTAGIQGLQGSGRRHLCLQKNDVKRIHVHTAICKMGTQQGPTV